MPKKLIRNKKTGNQYVNQFKPKPKEEQVDPDGFLIKLKYPDAAWVRENIPKGTWSAWMRGIIEAEIGRAKKD